MRSTLDHEMRIGYIETRRAMPVSPRDGKLQNQVNLQRITRLSPDVHPRINTIFRKKYKLPRAANTLLTSESLTNVELSAELRLIQHSNSEANLPVYKGRNTKSTKRTTVTTVLVTWKTRVGLGFRTSGLENF